MYDILTAINNFIWGNGLVFLKVGVHIHPPGAEAIGVLDVHTGAHTEGPGLIAAGGNHAPLAGQRTDDQRLAFQFGIVPDLHGSVECIHIHMNNNLLHFLSLCR